MFSVWQGAHSQLGTDMGTSPLVWHTRPDFVSMLADKFNNDLGDDCNDSAPDLLHSANNDPKQYSKDSRQCQDDRESEVDEDNEASECNLLESKARGRHQS